MGQVESEMDQDDDIVRGNIDEDQYLQELTPEALAEIKKEEEDKKTELHKLVKKNDGMGLHNLGNAGDGVLENIFKRIDADNSKTIDLDEFNDILS